MQTLMEIIDKYKLDTDKESIHKYISGFYEGEFVKYQDKHIKILEAGCAYGYSALLWNYYFPNSEIYTMEWESTNVMDFIDYPRIKLFRGDVYQDKMVNSLPNFDIIIDDADHLLEYQCSFLELYQKKLKKGGVLIIEDTTNEKTSELIKRVDKDKTYEIVDLTPYVTAFDSVLFIVRN